MLVEISRRWNSVRQENDFLSRIGGDEFAFIITGFGDVDEVSARAERYLYCFRDRFVINDRNFYNTASMGVALYPDNAQDFTHLLSYADTAMYKAKEKGKHRLCLFRKSQTDAVIENVNKEDFIRKAVQDERFKLMFQPQYSDCGNKLRGFEALIRILSEEGDILPPAEYIRLAEKLNIITDIDRWVMKNAPKTFKPALEVNSDLKLSINVSVSYLLDDFFLTDLEKFINDADVSPANIEIEITESLFISSFEQANKVLHSLRDMGVSVALDDFGTGYSSLSYLNSMPIDTLKIDKCFIDGLDDSKEREFVKEIIKIGHLLNFKIVSEGVEYNEQMESLDSFGCDIIQGYLLGRPETMEKAMDLVYDEICGQDKAAVN
jgi:polar amino acid transport system substrate-binding protein